MESVRWSANTLSFLAKTAGSSALTFITSSDDPPETILRIRGELVGWIDALSVPATAVDVAIGIALVPEGSSTNVQWDPATEGNAPWFMYERFTIGYEEFVTDVIAAQGLAVFRKTIDVKAMRIIRPDVEAQCVMTNTTINGADAVNVVLSARVLLGAT